MVVETDWVYTFAVLIVAVSVITMGNGTDGRRITIDKAVTYRSAIYVTIVHIAAGLVYRERRVMVPIGAIPLELGLAAWGLFRVFVFDIETIPAALKAETILLRLGGHDGCDEGE